MRLTQHNVEGLEQETNENRSKLAHHLLRLMFQSVESPPLPRAPDPDVIILA